MIKRISLLLMTGVLTLAMLTGCTSNAAGQKTVGTAVDGNEVLIEAAAIKLVNATNEGGYSLISQEELKGLIDNKEDAIIIDTMPADFYGKGHIPTALNAVLPKASLEDATEEEKEAFVALLGDDKDKTIIIYCGFTACGRSHVGAKLAVSLGYTNVKRLPGGIVGWQDAGYEVEK